MSTSKKKNIRSKNSCSIPITSGQIPHFLDKPDPKICWLVRTILFKIIPAIFQFLWVKLNPVWLLLRAKSQLLPVQQPSQGLSKASHERNGASEQRATAATAATASGPCTIDLAVAVMAHPQSTGGWRYHGVPGMETSRIGQRRFH